MKSERKLDFTPPLNEGTKTAQQNWTRRPRRLVWAAGRQPGWFLLAAPQAIMRFLPCSQASRLAIAWRESPKRSFAPLGRRGVRPLEPGC